MSQMAIELASPNSELFGPGCAKFVFVDVF